MAGSIPQLGNWSSASAVKLNLSGYPTWAGVVEGLPPLTAIEWRCIERHEARLPNTADAWEPDGNGVLVTRPFETQTETRDQYASALHADRRPLGVLE